MTYDNNAKKLAVKAIGTVESSLIYDSINYSDPITVGIAQWFGTRAAALLTRMKATSSWSGVRPSIDNDLNNIPASSSFWNTRYLTTVEGDSIKPVLTACSNIQVDQLQTDLEVYKTHFVGLGMDADADTNAMIMFFVAYHQGPVYANNAFAAAAGTPHPTLAQARDAILADPVLGGYPTRYNTAYDIINSGDTSGIPDPGGSPEAPNPGGGNGGAGSSRSNKYLTVAGNNAELYLADGSKQMFYTDGRGRYLPAAGSVTTPTDPPQPPPTGGDWVHPLPTGVMTSPYGPRSFDGFHWGCDFSTPGYAGKIYAPTDMIITEAGYGLGSFNDSAGWCIKAHTTDLAYTFCFYHQEYGSLQVAVGDTVTKGTWIGIEGATGNVTGRHLHFELYEGNYPNPWPPPYGPTPIDPIPLLHSKGVTT
jgi:murein DD-endopeptidase MepM/ murein hydrolase activator NlpD